MKCIPWILSFLLSFSGGSAIMVVAVEVAWAACHHDLDSVQLRTEKGWEKIANDHPFGTFAMVHTDHGVYDTNLSVDPAVATELGRIATQ